MLETRSDSSSLLSKLPDIDDTEPLSDADRECIAEIRDVLVKHGRLQRFGISLLHQHFDLADDECLVETCDPQNRRLTIRPVSKSELEGKQTIETNWRLDCGESLMLCTTVCFGEISPDGHPIHNVAHLQEL